MKRNTEAAELLGGLEAEYDERVDEVKSRASLIVAAFVEAQPEVPAAPAPEPAPQARQGVRIRIPDGARHRLSTAEKKESSLPVDSADPVVHSLLTGLNGYLLWLMAEAVCAVEKYYRSLFATMGYLDAETWPCSSFGDLRMAEVYSKPPAWFRERGEAFVESHGMIAVADMLASALPALKHSADVRTPPGVWFRGAGLFQRIIMEGHGTVSEAKMDEWFRAAGVEANEALRVLGILSCIRVHGEDAALLLIDTSQAQGADYRLTRRFESILARAQECVHAGHVAAMEHFGLKVAPELPPPVVQQQPSPPPPSPQPAPVQAPLEVPKGKDPGFVPIKLQEPAGAGRFRAVKGPRP